MLRNKSVATSRKQALMGDYGTLPSPTDKYRKPTSSLFLSPRLFTGFSSKGFTETESLLSPTSILDSKPFSAFKNPFRPETQTPKTPKPETRTHWDKLDSRGIGLGIVDALKDEKSSPNLSKTESRMVLFGSQLKIQIPLLPPSVLSPAESPRSPADFGIKTRNSQVGRNSPSPAKKSLSGSPPGPFAGCLSASEMELSEDYTCVISYGPNPRTTHIFDDCIIESCCGVVGFSAVRRENGFSANRSISMSYPSESFLSLCYSCKKMLGQGKDIYIYRGEKAFCSSECRYKETMLEEGMGKLEPDDHFGDCS